MPWCRFVSVFDKFAMKYFYEALKDLERARRAMDANDYPQAIFYAQQCVEKCVKSMLEIKRRVVYNHGPELISIFYEAFEKEWEEGFNIVVEALEYLIEYYTRSRYPFLFRGDVYSPEEIITRDIAEKGFRLAEEVAEVVRSYLKRRNVI